MNVEPIITPVGESKSYFEKNKKMIIVLIIMLLIFCGLVTFLFLSSRPGENKAVNGTVIDSTNSTEPTPVVSEPVVTNPIPTPTTTYNPILPEGWSLENIAYCNIAIPLPPASGSYYVDNGETYYKWGILQNNVLSAYPFQQSAVAKYFLYDKPSNDVMGNDDKTNSVNISCEEGTLTPQQVADKFNNYYSQVAQSADTVTFAGKENRWGEDVQILNFNSVNFGTTPLYTITRNGWTYLIRFNNGITTTAEQIANNLVFLP